MRIWENTFPKTGTEDDQISSFKTMLPRDQLYIQCGDATNKETGKESLLCWHGIALRMRQHKLEEKPALSKCWAMMGNAIIFIVSNP